VFVFTRN